eukprot:SRR837773.20742.p1 GENE.SRR837773.20742~~SRR837773.20742.p1  ORF type:complete len:161 (-),score=52.97 SRR837773.20742:240-662(-)
MILRHIMRLVADWDLPRVGSDDRPFPVPTEDALLQGVLEEYPGVAPSYLPERPVRPVPRSELRTHVAKIHYGMGAQDPITRVVFHSTKTEASRGFSIDHDAKPLRQKVFVFWNPDSIEDLQDQVTLTRLMLAFKIGRTSR